MYKVGQAARAPWDGMNPIAPASVGQGEQVPEVAVVCVARAYRLLARIAAEVRMVTVQRVSMGIPTPPSATVLKGETRMTVDIAIERRDRPSQECQLVQSFRWHLRD